MMLDSKKRSYSDAKVVTIIGQGTTFVGEIKSKGTIRIEGVVTGLVHSDDTVVVQESGHVKAQITAGQVIISGEVHGNVSALERIEITAQARLFGDIMAPRISIAEGVTFEGKCTMKSPGAAQPAATPQAASPAPEA